MIIRNGITETVKISGYPLFIRNATAHYYEDGFCSIKGEFLLDEEGLIALSHYFLKHNDVFRQSIEREIEDCFDKLSAGWYDSYLLQEKISYILFQMTKDDIPVVVYDNDATTQGIILKDNKMIWEIFMGNDVKKYEEEERKKTF